MEISKPLEDLDQTPAMVAAQLCEQGAPGLVFMDSSAPSGSHALSLITAFPRDVLRGHLGSERDCARLRSGLAGMHRNGARLDTGIPSGGLFGAVNYDGSFAFGLYEQLLVFDHSNEKWHDIGGFLGFQGVRIDESVTDDWGFPDPPSLTFEAAHSRDWYIEAVRRAQDYIAAGDIYQANISQEFKGEWPSDAEPFAFYQRLREVSPAPNSAYLDLGDRQVLSASPESFLKMSGNLVSTSPIKGTRPRFRDHERDEKSAYDLLTSSKEVSELIMITDLERNDLGRVSEFGTVQVTELLKIERFEHVFHLVSTVTGQLRADVDHLEAFKACFPGGSITGAPKKRAMEIIAELEVEPRGLYTGAIGYLGANGESQFNIAIRTAIIEDDTIRFHVGAGIVADSDPDMEYEETLHKAAGMFRAAECAVWSDAAR